MKILDLSIKHLQIPFTLTFSHASASRTVTDSVLVQAASDNNVGYGESCPRKYVTDESHESVVSFFQKNKSSLLETIIDFPSLKAWSEHHRENIDQNPAAWCAIELAILDLFAKEENATVEKLLALPDLAGDYQYTAVLGDNNLDSFAELVRRYQALGFKDYKIKLSGDIDRDKVKCDFVVAQIKGPRIRLDANNLWQTPDNVIQYINAIGHTFWAIEEPLQSNDYDGLSAISNALELKVILDESFVRYQQFNSLKQNVDNWIINVRISKMGGLLRSLDIVKYAKQLGISCIIGAQVGETSILTRAAITLANSYREIVLAQEGACGTYLLQEDICDPVLMFNAGGKITHKQIMKLSKHGFGLDIK